jgi:hypothetical protein
MSGTIQNNDIETKRNSHLFLGLIVTADEPAKFCTVMDH